MAIETHGTLHSTTEVAQVLGVSDETIRRWVANGTLRGIRIGGVIRIPLGELDRVLRDRRILRAAGSAEADAASASAYKHEGASDELD